jgi:hypothetical protein
MRLIALSADLSDSRSAASDEILGACFWHNCAIVVTGIWQAKIKPARVETVRKSREHGGAVTRVAGPG